MQRNGDHNYLLPDRSLPPAGAAITVDRLRSTRTSRGCDLTVARMHLARCDSITVSPFEMC